MFDYLIFIAYSKVPTIKQCLDNICDNNLQRDELQAAMNMKVPGKKFDDFIKKDTFLYKLSWREEYSLETDEGKESIYQYFLKMKT